MNKRVGKPNNMRVRYECAHCSWNGKTLPLYNIMLETEMMKETFDFDFPFKGASN
jgi:hypothetical protein